MHDEINKDVSNAQIMHSIGQLTGTVQAMHQGMTARLEDMRADIRRIDMATNDRMNRIEDNLSKQIDAQGDAFNTQIGHLEKAVGDRITGLGTRVNTLETEEKRVIEKVARLSAMGGGIGGALAAGVVELIKHL